MCIISILLFFSATGYINGIQNVGHEVDYVEDMNVDGSDFSPIANLFIEGYNGMMQCLAGIVAVIGMILISLILLIPWRLIAIKEISEISKKELDMAKRILMIFAVIMPVTGCVLTRFRYIFIIALLALIPVVFLLVLSILPLKNAYKQMNENQAGPFHRYRPF